MNTVAEVIAAEPHEIGDRLDNLIANRGDERADDAAIRLFCGVGIRVMMALELIAAELEANRRGV